MTTTMRMMFLCRRARDYSHPPVQRYEDLPKNGENKPETNSEDQPSGGEGA